MSSFQTIINHDGTLLYKPGFDQKYDLNQLMKGIIWRNDQITMFGKTHPQPRMTAWYGDKNIVYTYSKITMTSELWTPPLFDLKTRLEEVLNCEFNSVLINYYRDGNDHMSWHSDNEKSLGKNPTIASLSYGAERIFQLKHKKEDRAVVNVTTASGSLIVMRDELQSFWSHRLVKSKKINQGRLNLTFRYVHQL